MFYSFDIRGKSIMNYASHYTDDNVFGQRAKMRVPMHRYTAQLHLNNQDLKHNKIVAVLEVENLRQEDTGIYKCRADFKQSPTKNHRFRLSVLSKLDTNMLCPYSVICGVYVVIKNKTQQYYALHIIFLMLVSVI